MQHDTRWIDYNRHNERDPVASELWIRGLARWLTENGLATRESRVLDYGCGYFDLGARLAPHVRSVDGYDPDEASIAVARESTPAGSLLTSRLDDLAGRSYDLVVLNSVAQYMGTMDNLRALVQRCRDEWLANAAGVLVLSDLIPKNYSAALDAIENLGVALRNGCGLRMIRHLARAARRGSGLEYLKIDADQIAALASSERMQCDLLDSNLTPSRRRYSVTLRSS